MNLTQVSTLDKLSTPHVWFAWKPIWIESKTDNGTVLVQSVWLCRVKRTLVRVQGLSVFKYEPL